MEDTTFVRLRANVSRLQGLSRAIRRKNRRRDGSRILWYTNFRLFLGGSSSKPSGIPIAYYYLDFKNASEHDAHGLLTTLLFQDCQ